MILVSEENVYVAHAKASPEGRQLLENLFPTLFIKVKPPDPWSAVNDYVRLCKWEGRLAIADAGNYPFFVELTRRGDSGAFLLYEYKVVEGQLMRKRI